MQLLCSTGVFTRSSDPYSHEAILRYGHELIIDGLEIIFYPRWYEEPQRIIQVLRTSRLLFPVLHAEKSIGNCFSSSDASERELGLRRFEQNCAFARQIETQIVVLHLWEMPSSDIYLEQNLLALARCLDLADHYGLTLAIETIPCTYADPLTNIKRAVEHDPRAQVALDTEFLALHNQLEDTFTTPWLWQSNLVRHVHIKDHAGRLVAGTGRRYLHPGEGQIDFHRFVQQLKAVRFDGTLSLEARAIDHNGQVEIAHIQKSLHFMRSLIAEGESEP